MWYFSYVEYIENLCHRHYNTTEPTLYDQFCSSYRDNLQSPLHPLSDNLDSETYRIMEKDPVKYEQYERALTSAMRDLSRGMSAGRDKYSIASTSSGWLLCVVLIACYFVLFLFFNFF